MKTFFNKTALLLALFVAAISQPIFAQVGGNKPEFFLWRYNAGNPAPTPVLNADVIGTIQFKGTVPGLKIVTGADIQAVATDDPTDITLPARLSLRTGSPILTERLTVLQNGNVGINTTSPLYRFHVEGNAYVSGDFNVGGNFNVAGSITAGLDVIAGRDVKAGRHVVAVENVSGKNLMASENVSGKNVSATELVSGKNVSATELVSTKNLTATETISGKNINATQNINAGGTVSANQVSATTVSAGTVNSSGNITANGTITGNKICTQSQAIGVAGCSVPAGFRLAVGGGIIAEEVRVELQGAWPDYVFSENHKLPELTELAVFLQKEKHLPGIPSAVEMEKNGIDLGEMQRKTIEKVEELFLLTIQLNTRINQLEAENTALKTSKN